MADEPFEQIAIRVPRDYLVQADKLVMKLKKTPEGQALGAALTRSYILRRALVSGLEELKEEYG